MALVSCAGLDVLFGQIHFMLRGPWWSELALDTRQPPAVQTSVVVSAVGGLSVAGTVVRSVFDAAKSVTRVRVMGGAGGLSVVVPPAAYRNTQLRDPLSAIVAAAGEKLSPTIASAILSTPMPSWVQAQMVAAAGIDQVAAIAGANWRVLADGTIWVGLEAWPSASLPPGADVLSFESTHRYVLGCDTPALLPGVNLTDIGANVVGVDHYIEADKVRTWAWI